MYLGLIDIYRSSKIPKYIFYLYFYPRGVSILSAGVILELKYSSDFIQDTLPDIGVIIFWESFAKFKDQRAHLTVSM